MTTYKVEPDPNCMRCWGTGTITEYNSKDNKIADKESKCKCVLEQLPKDFDERLDNIDIVYNYENIFGRHGPEYEG